MYELGCRGSLALVNEGKASGASADGAYAGRVCMDRACTGGAYADRACADGGYIDRGYADGACADGVVIAFN